MVGGGQGGGAACKVLLNLQCLLYLLRSLTSFLHGHHSFGSSSVDTHVPTYCCIESSLDFGVIDRNLRPMLRADDVSNVPS